MNQKMILGILALVGLTAALALPVMHLMNKESPPEQQVASTVVLPPQPTLPTPVISSPPAQPVPAPAPLVWEGTYAPPPKSASKFQQQQRGAGGKKKQAKDTGPALTQETLVGTAWQIDSPQGVIMVEFGANGQGSASHPLVGAIPATWHVQGDKVLATASFMGQTMTIDATIQGEMLVAKGQNIRRMR
ncbi:MAG: hypothetical protein KAH38_12755 [Candidatus Hydrogenedentes bacterium]|nr:hypothetical protein [Candidatus Hydrogenedentota bacterium]